MKSNFVVSVYKKNWIDGAKKLFIAEPYIYQELEKNGELIKYEEIETIRLFRRNKKELIHDHDFVDEKYEKYVDILSDRLNQMHGVNFKVEFWKKSLGLGIIRYITLLYDMFQICETSFSPDRHECKILSEKSYYMPQEFDEQRDLFQGTAYGQEQLFSLYIRTFYPGFFVEIDDSFRWPNPSCYKKKQDEVSIYQRLSRLTFKKIILKLSRKVLNLRAPKVGIVQSFFSESNFDDLLRKSNGLIQEIKIKEDFDFESNPNWVKREWLGAINQDFDRFDQFFFASIKCCFPKFFIEEFAQIYSNYESLFSKYKKMTHVINESWIGTTRASFAMAVIQKMGMQHVYNEHNFLNHQFLCNNHKYILPLVDKFITLGPRKVQDEKYEIGSSLREWSQDSQLSKVHTILYISGEPPVKTPEFSASYGSFGAFNAQSQLDFVLDFFKSLTPLALNSMVYRPYPVKGFKVAQLKTPMVAYDQVYVLREFIKQLKLVDNGIESSQLMMCKSRLVICDYLSTSYVESMLSNTPTIFFLYQDSYLLNEDEFDFYDTLISVGICHKNPITAAKFVDDIKDEPEKWWCQQSVQDAKNKFLSNNLGENGKLKHILLNLT